MSDQESTSAAAVPSEETDEQITNDLENDRLDDELEPYRGSAVGTNDPNIVGDVGPFDTPPGKDPDSGTDLDE